MIDKNAGIPITVARPEDVERGEPVIYHPLTNSRVIFRNSGDIDVEAGDASVNVVCNFMTVSNSLSVGSGATGSFASSDGKTITVNDGIVTGIV